MATRHQQMIEEQKGAKRREITEVIDSDPDLFMALAEEHPITKPNLQSSLIPARYGNLAEAIIKASGMAGIPTRPGVYGVLIYQRELATMIDGLTEKVSTGKELNAAQANALKVNLPTEIPSYVEDGLYMPKCYGILYNKVVDAGLHIGLLPNSKGENSRSVTIEDIALGVGIAAAEQNKHPLNTQMTGGILREGHARNLRHSRRR